MSNVLVTEIVNNLEILPVNLQNHVLAIVCALSHPFKNEQSQDHSRRNIENLQRESVGQQTVKRAETVSTYDLNLASKALEGDCGRVIIDKSLLAQLESVISESKVDRITFIQDALLTALQTFQTRKLEEQHRRGYELHPVEPDEFNIWGSDTDWDDE